MVDPLDDVDPKSVEQVWQAARAELDVQKSENPGLTLTYVQPSCSLRYEVRSRATTELAAGRNPIEVATTSSIRANPGDGGLTLQVLGMQLVVTIEGGRNERNEDVAAWPPALVVSKNTHWQEIDGPSTLWATDTQLAPLVTFFPRLTSDKDIAWPFELFQATFTRKLEASRAAAADPPPKPKPDKMTAVVHFEGWISIADVPAARLRAEWSTDIKKLRPSMSRRREKWRAHYVVLQSGVVLHAALQANTWNRWSVADEQENSKLGERAVELRLVESCVQPVLPAFGPVEAVNPEQAH